MSMPAKGGGQQRKIRLAGRGNDGRIATVDELEYDVLVIGGALAGASTGLLVKRQVPEARVLIVDKSTRSPYKVGESTSEIAGCFLSRILRLGGYLSREQIAKNGLRFWFHGQENENPAACAEMGPKLQTRLPAWQLDRSTLDPHVLSEAVAAGCDLWRPATVREITTPGDGSRNTAVVTRENGETVAVKARWLIDASGKAAVLARQRGWLEDLAEHPTHSMWTRFRGVGDLDSEELTAAHPELAKRVWALRGTATNHLTGRGWWVWIIPLKGGETSIGITWDRRLFDPPKEGSVADRLLAHLRTHPVGHWLMRQATAIEGDGHQYKQLAYRSRHVGGTGWAVVGDAAGFMDPLYSHGIDFIGNTVWAATRLVIRSLRGEDVAKCALAYDQGYRESYDRWFRALYLDKYEYIGDAELMNAAVLLDVGFYFLWPVRLAYRNHAEELTNLPYAGKPGGVVAAFMAFYNRRLAALARKRVHLGCYGRRNTGHHFIFRESFHPSAKVLGLVRDGLVAWAKAEISTAWLGLAGSRAPSPAKPASPVPNPSTAT